MTDEARTTAERPHSDDALPLGARARLGTNRLNHICYRSPNDGLCCLAFSPDCRYLIGVGYDDGEATLWELPSDREVWRFVANRPWGGNRGVGCAAFSPDSRLVAVDGGIPLILDVANGHVVKELASGITAYWGLTFSPCGKYLARASYTQVLVLAVETWETVASLEPSGERAEKRHREVFDSVAFSPDGRFLAAGSFRVWVWEWAVNSLVNCLEAPESAVSTVHFLPDGRVAAAVRDGTVRVWNPVSGRELLCHRCATGHDNTWPPVFRADGRAVAIPGRVSVVLDVESGVELGRFSGYQCRPFALSSDGRLVAESWLGRVDLVDAETGSDLSPAGRHFGGPESIVFSDDGRRVFTTASGVGFVWDAASADLVATAPFLGRAMNTLRLAPDGARAVYFEERKIRLWDIKSGNVTEFPLTDTPSALTWTTNGRGVIVAVSGQLLLFPLDGVPSGMSFATVEQRIRSLCCLSDGSVVGASRDGAYVWNSDGSLSSQFALPEIADWARRSVAVSSAGMTAVAYDQATFAEFATQRELASPTSDNATIQPLSIPEGFGVASGRGWGLTAEFLADSRLLIAACRGESDDDEPLVVRVWEAATWRNVWESPAFACGISGVAFAPGARTLAVALEDATTVLFDVPVRPTALNLSWRTSTVLALAMGIDTEDAFERMPILADALQDAGCDDEDVLGHLHSGSPHRGRWVVDLLLGSEAEGVERG